MPNPTLSVLIPTVPSRVTGLFLRLLHEVQRQANLTGEDGVEVLGLYDNKKRSVGAKRNALLDLARGDFLTFLDDDDWVTPDYLPAIRGALAARPDLDVLVYPMLCTIDGGPPKRCVFGVEYPHYADTPSLWSGPPSHTMVWRTELARRERFPDQNFQEDTDWATRMARHVDPARQGRLETVLYHYNFRREVTETR